LVKTLKDNPVNAVEDIIKDKFKSIKSRYSLNLDSVLKKSFDRSLDVGVQLGGKKTQASNIKSRLNALKKVMIGDIDKIENEASQNTARVIASAYASGIPSGKIASALTTEVGGIDYKTSRAIRTNTVYLSSLTKLTVWDSQGFTHYKWVLGIKDAATRKQHKIWHGKEFSIKVALSGRAPIPGHVTDKNGKVILGESINCRCGISLSR